MKIDKFFWILFLTFYVTNAQNSIKVKTDINFNEKHLELEKNYVSKSGDTLSFEMIKFYISDFQIIYMDNTVIKTNNSYHLIDIEKPESLEFDLDNNPKKKIKSLKFSIGIDSLTNVSGAMGNDLDLTNGMYWAWQSGYINIKIEGKSNSCHTRKNKFHYHIGGYLKPVNSIKNIELYPINNPEKVGFSLTFDFYKLFSEINIRELNEIMQPSEKALQFAAAFQKIITLE